MITTRKPKVKNKYNLKFKDIKQLKIADRTKICEPLFWRNDVVKAWCIIGGVGTDTYPVCDRHEYWIGIYDNDKIKCDCSCYSGMCGYNFKEFYNPSEIECEQDLKLQEMLLDKINQLIDSGILRKE
jgi:hypothetical protein